MSADVPTAERGGFDALAVPVRPAVPDHDLATATRALVSSYAPGLGLDPGAVSVATGPAGRRAAAFGARGLVEGGRVHLAPAAYDPATGEGRALLVHELAHLAQQRTLLRSPRRGAPTMVEPAPAAPHPEVEARALAAAAAGGTALWRPRASLAPHAVAADHGLIGELQRPAPPVAQAPAGDESKQLETQFDRVVNVRHGNLRTKLSELLGGLTVSRDDVQGCLQVLEPVPFVVARTLVKSLTRTERVDLGFNLDDDHHRWFPATAVAALGGMAPDVLGELKVENVQGIDPRGFGPVELRTAYEAVRSLRKAVTLELLKGPRKAVFSNLMKGKAPAGTDADAFQAVIDADALEQRADVEEREEGAKHARDTEKELEDTLAKVRKGLAKPSASAAVDALVALAGLADAPVPDPLADPHLAQNPSPDPNGAPGPEPPDPGRRLRRAAKTLDGEGLVSTLLGALDASERRIDGPHAGQLLLVLAAREQHQNLRLAEELLSYKLLDWAVTDAEARFAYVLVRSLPLAAQDRWRRLDAGKWFQRLEENIPRGDVLAGKYRGVGSGADPVDLKVSNALLDDVTDEVREIDRLIAEKGVDGMSSVSLLRKILNWGHVPGATTPIANPAQSRRLEVLARRLDTLGHLDTILDALPDAFIMDERWRPEVLELLAVRDPRHLERHLRRLLDYGVFDWAVTAHEAWLAFQLVRSLPVGDRTRFEEEDPDRFARIQSEMTPDMRASAANTQLGGRDLFAARDRLRDRLRNPALWTAARKVELRSLAIQLNALDDRHWLFLESKRHNAYKDPGLAELLEDLRLYLPPQQSHFEPERLRRTPYGAEGPFEIAGLGVRFLLVGLKNLFLDRLSFLGKTVGVENLNLDDIEWGLGGDMSGARLADRDEVKKRDAKEKAALPDPNWLTLSIDDRQGIVRLTLPRLELSGFNGSFTNTSLRTGRISLEGVDITASFSDRGYERPAGATVDATKTDVRDAVLTGPGLPGSLIALTRLLLGKFHFVSGRTGEENLTEPTKDGWIAIPVLEPFLRLLSHIVSFTGTVPGLSSALSAPFAPLAAGAPWAAKQFSSTVTGEALSPIAMGLIGLATDGTFRPPRTVGERAADAASMMRAFSVSIDDIDIEGLSFGGVEQVATTKIQGLLVGVGLSKPNVLRAKLNSMQRRYDRPGVPLAERRALEVQILDTELALMDLEEKEKVLDKLESRHRWNEDSLSADERKTLKALSDELRQEAGATLDVGSIGVGRLSGQVEAEGFDIGAIHAEVSMDSRLGEALPDEELVERFQVAERGARTSTKQEAKGVTGSASVGSLTLRKGADAGSPALRIKAGRLPTVLEFDTLVASFLGKGVTGEGVGGLRTAVDIVNAIRGWVGLAPMDLEEAVKAVATDPRYVPEVLELLRTWRPRLEEALALQERSAEPVDLDGKLIANRRSKADEARYQTLRAQILERLATTVDTIAVSGITATFDPDQLSLDVVAGRVDVTGIRSGATRIGAVRGDDVMVGLALDDARAGGQLPGDLEAKAGQAGLDPGQQGLRFGARTLSVTDVEQPGLELKRFGLEGLSGKVVPDGDDLRIPELVVARGMELEGLSYRSPGMAVDVAGTTKTGRMALSARVKTAPDPKGGAGARRVSEVVVEWLRLARVDADRIGIDMAGPDGRLSVDLTSGSLLNVRVDDLHLNLGGEELTYRGKMAVGQLEQLRFAVVTRAVERGVESAPTKIKGTLSGPAVEPGAGQQAAAVQVEFIESGSKKIDLHGVEMTEGELTTEAGTVVIRRAGIGGHLETDKDGTVRFDRLGPMTIDLAAIDWRTAGGAQITARGATVLNGVLVKGSWKTPKPVADTEAKKQPTRVLDLDELSIARVTSDNLRYVDGNLDVHLGRDEDRKAGKAPKRDLLEINDVLVRGLHWDDVSGVTAGTVDTGKSKVDAEAMLSQAPAAGKVVADALRVRAAVAADSIHLSFFEGGKLVARVKGVSGELGVGEGEGDDLYHAKFSGLDSGRIEIGPDGIDVKGLDLGVLSIDTMSWHGASIGLVVSKGMGSVDLGGVHVDAHVDLHPPGHAGGRFKRLVLSKFVIDETRAHGLSVPMGGFVIKLNPTQEAILGPITLTGLDQGDPFVVEATSSKSGFNVKGRFNLAGLNLPGVEADILSSLENGKMEKLGSVAGNAAATNLKVDFMGVDGLRVVLSNPSLTAVRASIGDHHLVMVNPDAALPEFGIRADEVTYEQGPRPKPGGGIRFADEVTVKGLGLKGLVYSNPALGLKVGVESADVPGTFTHDFKLNTGTIKQLDISNAFFQLDMTKLIKSAAGGGDKKPKAERVADIIKAWDDLANALRPYADLIGGLNGTLNFNVFKTKKGSSPDMYPIRLKFVDGAFDFQRLGANLPWVSFSMDKDDVVLTLAGFTLLRWRLSSGEVTRARKSDLLGIMRALQPTPESQQFVAEQIAGGDDDPPSWISIGGISADLSLKYPEPLKVRLSAGNEIVLSKNAVSHLRFAGNVAGTNLKGKDLPGELEPISLDAVNIDSTKFTFDAAELGTGRISVEELTDAHLTFLGFKPQLLSGRIKKATAHDITWTKR